MIRGHPPGSGTDDLLRCPVTDLLTRALKVPFLLPVFHSALAALIVGSRSPLGLARRSDFCYHFIERRGFTFHSARTRHVANRAEPDRLFDHLFVGLRVRKSGLRI